MNQPMFTFSPDGVSIYAFTPGPTTIKVVATIFFAFLVCLALALVELAQLVLSAVTFFLTAPETTLIRFFAFVIALALVYALAQYLRFRSASLKAAKAGA